VIVFQGFGKEKSPLINLLMARDRCLVLGKEDWEK
jgi:hypothetical protein